MKSSKIILFGSMIVVAVILAIVAVKYDFTGSVTSIDTNIDFVEFTHGEVSCIQKGNIVDSSTIRVDKPMDISCLKTFKITSNQCDVKLQLAQDIFAARKIEYDICTISGNNLYTSTTYTNCVSGIKYATADLTRDSGSTNWFGIDKAGNVYNFITLTSTQVLRIKNIQSTIGFSFDPNTVLFFIRYQPYAIHRQDTMIGNGFLSDSCLSIPSEAYGRLVAQATDSQEYNNLFTKTNYMYANQRFDYISTPVIVPFDENKMEKINGVYTLCAQKDSVTSSAYFAIEKITLSSGNSYYYPDYSNIVKDNVQCCNGDIKPGYYCNNELWVLDSVPQECSTSDPCKIQFETKYGAKQVYKQQCVSGTCENIIRNVECTENSQCLTQTGGYCSIDYTCHYISSGCQANADCLVGETCEDGKCIYKEETSYFWYVVIGFVVLVLIIIIIVIITKGKNSGGY